MTGADPGQPGRLVLAVPMRIHPVPQGTRIDGGRLGGFDPGRAVQRGLHPRLDPRAHVPFAPGHLGHVAGGHPHVFRQALQAKAHLPSPLPDVAALPPPFHHSALAVGALGGRDLHRTAQHRFDPRLYRRAHVLPAPRHLRHVADGHPQPLGQVLLAHAQGAGAFPDVGALPLDQAALPVDDPLAGHLAQHRHGPLPQQGRPGPAPAGHRGQVAVVDAHPVRQLLQVEAVPPGRRPEFALGLALALSLLRRLSGVSVVVEPCRGVDVGSRLDVASSKTQKAGPPHRDDPARFQAVDFQLSVAAHRAALGCRLVTPGATGLGSLLVHRFCQTFRSRLDDVARTSREPDALRPG